MVKTPYRVVSLSAAFPHYALGPGILSEGGTYSA
jgi:hypothetical protein